MNNLKQEYFHNEDAARAMLESIRWPSGPICGHCGERERRYATKRPGRYRCANPECQKDYTATTGTVMESSHIKLHVWLMAFYLMTSSKKGMSALQLHRMLGTGSYRTAWFMGHRIREAMRQGGLGSPLRGIVEADETGYGSLKTVRVTRTSGKPYLKRKPKSRAKRTVVALVQRGGEVRSFHVPRADKETVAKIVNENVTKEAKLFTDESQLYKEVGGNFAAHETVRHSAGEYARGGIHTNTIEGYFGIFKRGMVGVYHHCAEKHLHRYLAEFDFRYNHRQGMGYDDTARMEASISGIVGKRLTYRQSAHQA